MNPAHAPTLAIVPHGAEMRNREAELANAIVVTGIKPANLKLRIRDIADAVDKHFGPSASPVEIIRFAPDFIICFATHQEKDVLVQCGINFTTLLVPWTDEYRANIIYWNTEVAIDIRGFPPQACHRCCLEPLLSSYCSVQAFSFNRRRVTCRVDGYALSPASIPSHGHVCFQYTTSSGITNITFPVTMRAYLLSEAPEFKDDQTESDSASSVVASSTGNRLGMDTQPLQQYYEQQQREAHVNPEVYHNPNITNQDLGKDDEATSRFSIFHPSDLDLHDPRMDNSSFDSHGWESDRSWKLFRGRDI